MHAFLAHQSISGGANLMLTCVHLTLLAHYDSGRALGDLWHLQMDNTTSEMKTRAMLAYMAYQVLREVFVRARGHFNDKGHTHTNLDQTFRTLIRKLGGTAVHTIGELLECMRNFLSCYNCKESRELHAIFDIAGA
jgi:hypothetical protein